MILPPSDYERAVAEAVASAGRIVKRVYCAEHGGEIGVIRYTPRGQLFWADVPVESGSGVAKWRKRLRDESGRRPPPVLYQVRVLIEEIDEAPDPPKAWCEPGRHRLILRDFQSHSGILRVKPV